MRSQPVLTALFIIITILLIDLYSFRGISTLLRSAQSHYRIIIYSAFWMISLISVTFIIWFFFAVRVIPNQEMFRFFTMFMGFFILFYIPKLLFIAFQISNDALNLLAKLVGAIFPANKAVTYHVNNISRSEFLLKLGILISAVPFLSIFWGIWKGRYDYTVKKVNLKFRNLPEAFNELRIVQISDLHLGSFAGKRNKLEPAVRMINKLNADYLFFTGDLVNNVATEAVEFIPLLKKLTAKSGKYSILGNHDYGEYVKWKSKDELKANMEQLYSYHKQAGFSLMRNEYATLQKNGQSLTLIGVENWGLPPFPRYGNLQQAYSHLNNDNFKILLSHDPSHWDAEIRQISNIDLTLSGHTHGFQFAFRIPGWKWSPVKFKYPRWSGLYREGDQCLYVNIGLGFIGFPGRVGTPPEITLFTLSRG